MYPSFRGRKLDLQFSKNHIEEIVFLMGIKSLKFKLLIDKIELN
jgi:hypothetical protein